MSNARPSKEQYAKWRSWWRRYLDQVLTNQHLSSVEKLVAIGILHYTAAATGSTYVCPLTLAKALGLKLNRIRSAITALQQKGQIEVTSREGPTICCARSCITTPATRRSCVPAPANI